MSMQTVDIDAIHIHSVYSFFFKYVLTTLLNSNANKTIEYPNGLAIRHLTQ